MAIEPDSDQLGRIAEGAGGDADGPVVMLNLNRYRERAAYDGAPEAASDPGVSGREAYGQYGLVAVAVLERVGGRILWHADARQTVIGEGEERFDEVIAVWYPSRAAFMALVTAPEILDALAHRTAGLERAMLICCEAGQPVFNG